MGGHFIPSMVMFLWDYLAHKKSENIFECNSFYFSFNIGIAILFIIFKFIVYFLGPWSIFYLFYWENRKKFMVI
jgi:hypothetical protein